MSTAPSDVKSALQKTSFTLLQQIEALERRTSELKRSHDALELEATQTKQPEESSNHNDLPASGKPETPNNVNEQGKGVGGGPGEEEEEDRSKLPQVLGDESKQAILVDPRRWARERLATALREQGEELEQKSRPNTSSHSSPPPVAPGLQSPKAPAFEGPSPANSTPSMVPPKMSPLSGEGDGNAVAAVAAANAPGTFAKATSMMKGGMPNPSMGVVAKGSPLGSGPLSGASAGPPMAKLPMGCGPGSNGAALPKGFMPKLPSLPGLDMACGGPPLPCMGNMPSLGSGMSGAGCMPGPLGGMGGGLCPGGASMGGGPDSNSSPGEGDDMQQKVMLQMQMQMQMMMMGAMMGKMLGEGDEKKGKKRKKDKKHEDEFDDLPPGPSADMNHPSYRPPEMEQIPGITDRRFEGRITMWIEDKGYGFIGNDELKQKFNGMDVFLQAGQKRHFSQGDTVTFSVFKNYRGQPQATELRANRTALG